MTTWRIDWSTGKAVFCDEHGCCIGEHTVAKGNTVWEWKRFNMFKIIPDLLPDSHENVRESVPDPKLFEWHWPPEGSPYTIREFITTPHEHDYSRAATHHTAGATPRVYGLQWSNLLCSRHRSRPPAWSGIWIRLWLRIQHRLVMRSWSGRVACLVRLLNVTGGFTPSLSIL